MVADAVAVDELSCGFVLAVAVAETFILRQGGTGMFHMVTELDADADEYVPTAELNADASLDAIMDGPEVSGETLNAAFTSA